MSRTEDHLAITALLTRYCTGIDTRDWDLFAGVFTPQCRVNYGDIGGWDSAQAITEYMDRTHRPMGHTLHRLSNVTTTFSDTPPDRPDRALATAYVDVVLMDADNASGMGALGTYRDVLVRTSQGWQISERDFTLVRVAPLP